MTGIQDETADGEHLPEDARRDPVIRRWAHRECHVLAIALHRRTGWPLVTLHDARIRGGRRFFDEFGVLVHSGVAHPDGRFIDIRGAHDEAAREAIADLYIHDPWMWACWNYEEAPEAELLDVLTIDGAALAAALADAEGAIAERLLPLLEGAPPAPR